MRLIASLRVGHVHDDAIEPAEQIDPLFAIRYAGIFPSDDWSIEDRFAAHKIELVVSDVANALRFIPGRHALIVATKKPRVQVCL